MNNTPVQHGCGDSDHPPFEEGAESAYPVDSCAEDLRAVLDELGVERARVLGFSMGVVAAMASRLPEPIIQRARLVKNMLQEQGLEETYNFYFSSPLFKDIPNNAE